MSKPCDYPNCDRRARYICNSSCCEGGVQLCEEHNHREQYILDILGYPHNSLAQHHDDAKDIVARLWDGVEAMVLADGAPVRVTGLSDVLAAYTEAAKLVEQEADKGPATLRNQLNRVAKLLMKRAKDLVEG